MSWLLDGKIILNWLLDALGKLGPLAVAYAVYLANKRQSAFQREMSLRDAEVEDQKWRLALLDRREIALREMTEVITGFALAGNMADDAFGRIGKALRQAELVFEKDEEEAIRALLVKLYQWQHFKTVELRTRDQPELVHRHARAIEQQESLTASLLENDFDNIVTKLTEATRVKTIAPLNRVDR